MSVTESCIVLTVLMTSLQSTASPVRIAFQCIQQLGDSLPLFLNCSYDSSELIRVVGVAHGSTSASTEVSTNSTSLRRRAITCPELSQLIANESFSTLTTLQADVEMTVCADVEPYTGFVTDKCSAMNNCTVNLAELPTKLYDCNDRQTNFVVVTYQCLFTNGSQFKTDVCGSSATGPSTSARTTSGYITSPNYPNRYPPNVSCTCQLSIAGSNESDNSARILWKLIDFQMSTLPNDFNPADWVEYTKGTSQGWSNGRRFTPSDVISAGNSVTDSNAEFIATSSYVVNINFHSDAAYEMRGFWLFFTGRTSDGRQAVPVDISCQVYSPPEFQTSFTCYQPPAFGELYLTCRSIGVIDIMSAWRATMPDAESDTSLNCSPWPVQPPSIGYLQGNNGSWCIDEDDDIDALLDQCSSMAVCNPSVSNSIIQTCQAQSNYLQVDYRCIADGVRLDVCGLTLNDVTAELGYLTTPNYPSPYSPNLDCCCTLTSTQKLSQIIFYQLDSSLTTPDDWIEYSTLDPLIGVKKQVRLSANVTTTAARDTPIYTDSPTVLLRFHSDFGSKGRGLWMRFVGRSLGGSSVAVRVTCSINCLPEVTSATTVSEHVTENTLSVTVHQEQTPPPVIYKENVHNTDLIIGVTVALGCALMALCIGGLICFQQRRRNCTDSLPVSKLGEPFGTVPFELRATSLVSPGRRQIDKAAFSTAYARNVIEPSHQQQQHSDKSVPDGDVDTTITTETIAGSETESSMCSP